MPSWIMVDIGALQQRGDNGVQLAFYIMGILRQEGFATVHRKTTHSGAKSPNVRLIYSLDYHFIPMIRQR